jgi:hypothetical protein
MRGFFRRAVTRVREHRVLVALAHLAVVFVLHRIGLTTRDRIVPDGRVGDAAEQ